MGPDYRRPDDAVDELPAYQHAPAARVAAEIEDRWWEIFGNPELNGLVEEALKNNLDIRKAAARILEVKAQFVEARANRLPGVNAEGSFQRQRRPVETPAQSSQGGAKREGVTQNTLAVSLAASFELDLWGRLARAEDAARAEMLKADESRSTVAQTVVAQTVTAYLQMESLERQIDIAKKSIESYKRSRALVESRYRRGLTTILEVRQARRVLAQAEASLPSLRQELGVVQQTLAVLLGRYPKTRPPRQHPEDYYRRLAPVPPGLPSDLLLRRPDIKAAEAELMALNARVGVAKASRFPRISLTGSFGYTSNELNTLLKPESEIWSIAMGLLQPIFDAGKLRAEQRAAEARYSQGVAHYAKTVLVAFSEVESALLTRKEQLAKRGRVLKFLKEARATQKQAESRYMRGLTDYLNVLESQRTRFDAEKSLVLVDLAVLSNRVSLHRALGGGWDRVLEREGQGQKE